MTRFHRTVRFRITVQHTAVFALLFTLFGFGLYYGLRNLTDRQVDLELVQRAKLLLPELVVVNGEPVLRQSIDEVMSQDLRTAYFHSEITDQKGRVLKYSPRFRTPKKGPHAPPTPRTLSADNPVFTTFTNENERFRMAILPLHDDTGQEYFVRIGYPLKALDDAFANLRLFLIAGGPLIVAMAAVGGWILARGSLQPVAHITQAARQISAQGLDQRIPVRGVRDELDELAQTFNEMLHRLQASFEQARNFSFDAAHELRTPLTAMRGETEVALLKNSSAEELRRVLRSNLEEINRITAIVNDLLTVAQGEAGTLRVRHDTVQLSDLAGSIVETVQVLAEDKEVNLEASIEPGVRVTGDSLRLSQLLLNLLDNAIKHSAPGQTVRMILEKNGGGPTLRVEDMGCGIAEEDLPHIFDRFFRTDRSRSRHVPGSGLGLSISKWIVDAHGGSIEVASKLGSGSTFTVHLPPYTESKN
ncbi:MAG TPA: heavy metal sensor histidine kinase [Terriglobales bacterium]|jgi:heavy metal sensor kinase|nr:heavy metal sensor histidine kinase [Terriglobales bacterium]